MTWNHHHETAQCHECWWLPLKVGGNHTDPCVLIIRSRGDLSGPKSEPLKFTPNLRIILMDHTSMPYPDAVNCESVEEAQALGEAIYQKATSV